MNRKFFVRFIAFMLEISLLLALFMPSLTAAEAMSDISVDKAVDVDGNADSSEAEEAESEAVLNISPFPDVAHGDWYYEDVTRLVAEGIIHGYPDGSFRPDGNITYAEFTKILVNSIGVEGSDIDSLAIKFFEGHWSAPYINKAYELGILSEEAISEGFSPDMPIPRSKMTKMMVLALEIPLANIENPFIDLADSPDIYAATAYNQYLLRGYPAEDGYRIYDGEASATRGEASSIAVRIIDYKADPYMYRKSAILSNAEENPLLCESELIDLFYILNREFITEFTFESPIPYEVWSEYYRLANILHLEYFYTTYLQCSYIPSENKYTLKLEYSGNAEKLKSYAAASEERAKEILDLIITDDMDDVEKIIAIHDYIILNCKYDYDNYLSGNLTLESRLPYGVLINGSAICQGYSAAFNLLCRMAGIPSIVVTGITPDNSDLHAWNVVLIDGTPYFVDTTHDDPVPDREGRISRKYLLLTAEELASFGYIWDEEHTNIKYFY